MPVNTRSKKVAIIGAGPAGLVAARECLREGLEIQVFEKLDKVGGIWQYSEEVEDDLLGQNSCTAVHGSLYASLRTNLPRKLMAFLDFPFEPKKVDSQFVGHKVVLEYLESFVEQFDLYQFVEFNREVKRVSPIGLGRWKVIVDSEETEFDAVMVCNGHFSNPRVAKIEGLENFQGLLMHSHNYRSPERFEGKRVTLLGAAASATDLALEINGVADQVYWCAEKHAQNDIGGDIVRCPSVIRFGENYIELTDNNKITELDAFIFCTGYNFEFPFLEDGIVNVVDNWVHPLYLHMIPIHHPTIAIMGMLYSIIPFPLTELQSRWFAQTVSGKIHQLPALTMEDWFQMHLADLKASGRKQRNFHKMGPEQFSYMNLLARDTGSTPLPDWFEPLSGDVRIQRYENPLGFRNLSYSIGNKTI
tara:strand:+ start:80 stop:1333 length:1254 start_codon:yes stop_codon:yes gene_type:complete